MLNDALSATASILLALLIAFPLGKSLKKHPAVFYLCGLAMIAAFMAYRIGDFYVAGLQPVLDIVGKGYLACSLLAIVMFTGALGNGRLRAHLQPIRAQLSILSFILILGHVTVYLESYLPRISRIFATNTWLSVSLTIAILLTVIYAVLSATSLHIARVKMPFKIWKGIQRMSYLMVTLLWLHILLALGRGIFLGNGSGSTTIAFIIYSAITAAYAALRIRKALKDRRDGRHGHAPADEKSAA